MVQSQCDPGWSEKSGSCYKVNHKKRTWRASELECNSFRFQSHLASVHSQAENKDILDLLRGDRDGETDFFWIGGQVKEGQPHRRQAGRSDNWDWSDGSNWDYWSWYTRGAGEPNNANNNERCVVLVLDKEQDGWQDHNCEQDRHKSICKLTIQKGTTTTSTATTNKTSTATTNTKTTDAAPVETGDVTTDAEPVETGDVQNNTVLITVARDCTFDFDSFNLFFKKWITP